MRLDHLAHIVVLILQREGQHACTILVVEHTDDVVHPSLLLLELLGIVVADDIRNLSLLDRAVDTHTVVEALVTLGVLGALLCGKQRVELASNLDGVNHLILRISGVHVAALDCNLGRCGVEVLVLQLALEAAVHSVGEVGTKGSHVEEVDTTANLLVGSEPDADLAVLNLGVRHQVLRSGHNLRNATLVVSAQQRCAVGVNQRVTHELLELGELRNLHRKDVVQHDILTVVALDDSRLDILAAHIGCSIHVGDKSNHGSILVALTRRDSTHSVAILICHNLGQPECFHLLLEHIEQVKLLCCRGECFAIFI